MTLQALYGTIPQIFGKGECARVREMLLLKTCILFFATAFRSVWLSAPVGFLNPATGPSCHIEMLGSWPSGFGHLWPKQQSLLFRKSVRRIYLISSVLLTGTLPLFFQQFFLLWSFNAWPLCGYQKG